MHLVGSYLTSLAHGQSGVQKSSQIHTTDVHLITFEVGRKQLKSLMLYALICVAQKDEKHHNFQNVRSNCRILTASVKNRMAHVDGFIFPSDMHAVRVIMSW